MKLKGGNFFVADCFDLMRSIPDASIDMILCDLPYGTTKNKWDNILPLDKLWEQYNRICKGAIVITAFAPFTSILVCSNLRQFRYSLVWKKSRPTGHMNAKKQPLREHEDICVFYSRQPTYNPQFSVGKLNNHSISELDRITNEQYIKSPSTSHGKQYKTTERITNQKYPKSILGFDSLSPTDTLHPTQKPVPLFEYLIKTYTNEGDLVLDNCAGSGTTAIAAINCNRKWICMESDKDYAKLAIDRIRNHKVIR